MVFVVLKVEDLVLQLRLKNITAEFIPRKKYAIIGINGAGKSSLLNAITGVFSQKLLSGKVYINEKDILMLSIKDRSKLIACLSQYTKVLFQYSVMDVVLMGTYSCAIPHDSKLEVLDYIFKLLSLSKQKNQSFHTLSGGQKQRVHLARVLIQIMADNNNSAERWLLLDEHATGLDLYQQAQVFETLNHILATRNIGVIAVMHDINSAAKFCDEMLLIHEGKLLKKSSPKEVILDDNFERAFQIKVKYLSKEDAFLFYSKKGSDAKNYI